MKSINEIAKELNIGAEKVQDYLSSVHKVHVTSSQFDVLNIDNEMYSDIKNNINELTYSLFELSKIFSVGCLTLSRFLNDKGFNISFYDFYKSKPYDFLMPIPYDFYKLVINKFSNSEEELKNDDIPKIDFLNFDIIRYWAEEFYKQNESKTNSYDRIIFPNIPQSIYQKIKKMYPFIEEEIFYIRGVSNGLKEATIITSSGFYEIVRKCLVWRKNWQNIDEIIYFDSNYYFKTLDEDPHKIFSYNFFDWLGDESNAQVAHSFNIIIEYLSLLKCYQTDLEKFMFESENYESLGDKDKAAILYLRSKYYFEQKTNAKKALFELDKIVIPTEANKDKLYLNIFALRAELYETLGKVKESRNDRILSFSKNSIESKRALEKIDNKYIETLPNLRQRDNSAIIFVDDLSYCIDEVNNRIVDSISVFDIKNIPTLFKFKPNHPVKNTLYVRQSDSEFFYIPHIIPEDSFIERAKELCHLLICLGAKEIKIKSIKGKKISNFSLDQLNIEGSGGVKLSKVSGQLEHGKEEQTISEDKTEWQYTIIAEPQKEPYIPDDLFWYHTDINWQRLYQQRMNGVLQSCETLKSSVSTNLTSDELQNIQVDVNTILYKANVSQNKKHKEKHQETEEFEWVLDFRFEPLNKLTFQIDSLFKQNEYKEEVAKLLVNNINIKSISSLLSKYRDSLGVSEEKANYILEELKSKYKIG